MCKENRPQLTIRLERVPNVIAEGENDAEVVGLFGVVADELVGVGKLLEFYGFEETLVQVLVGGGDGELVGV